MTTDDEGEGCTAALPLLESGAAQLGISLDETTCEKFVAYCGAIERGNQTANLTGVRSPSGIMRTLFLDSLTVAAALPEDLTKPGRGTVAIDIGSGAGLPGIPLKLVFPAWSLVLLESIGKKARFLRETTEFLQLADTAVLQGRAEELARTKPWRECADLALARAVAPLGSLVELCAPFVRTGGWLAFPKSGDIARELNLAYPACRALRTELVAVVPVSEELGIGAGRLTVLYRKIAPTLPGYPRRMGLAQSRPIGAGPVRDR